MSRPHIHLPPAIYVAPPKPKKIEKRRRRGQIQADGSVKETHDASEIETALGLATPASTRKPLPGNYSPVDGLERRPDQTPGLLSQGTLKEMLLVQEESN